LATVSFPCDQIAAIDPITETTGGSVYVFTVHFLKDLNDLNLGLGTVTPNGMQLLEDFKTQVTACKGTAGSIKASDLQYQEEIYTYDGIRSGWVANISRVNLSSAQN